MASACNALSGVGDFQFGAATGMGGDSSAAGSGGASTTSTTATGGATGGDGGVGGAGASWYDGSFAYRRRLTIDHSGGTETLSDFPLLVRLDATRIDYGSMMDGGADLRFVDEDDATQLSFEIESWDAQGTSIVWLEVPDIPAGSADRFVWMYYGSASASDGQDRAGTWSNGYAAVWHLDPSLADSTGGGHDGTSSTTADAVGAVGRAREFDGVTSFIAIDDTTGIDGLFAGGGTICAWIYPRSLGENGRGRIVDRSTTTSFGNGWGFMLNTGGTGGHLMFGRGFATQAGIWNTPDGSIALNAWHHVAVVYAESVSGPDGLWIDGSPQGISEFLAAGGALQDESTSPLQIGNVSVNGSRTFDGHLDEVRLATVPRSAQWLAAQYRSMTDTVVSYGPEQSQP